MAYMLVTCECVLLVWHPVFGVPPLSLSLFYTLSSHQVFPARSLLVVNALFLWVWIEREREREREREGGRKWVFEKTVGRTNRTKLVVVAFIGVRSSAPRAASHKDQFILIKNRRDPPIINWNRKTLVKKTSVLEPRPRHACDVAVAAAAKVNSIRVFNSKPCGLTKTWHYVYLPTFCCLQT